ncbi:hypothetical protein DPMN_031323 [Dreissena polymorpha]|uniref:VWFA domain-containing protein n=1 Tax=Dreissena polymorpha TaxID=45954 RepID=A0A9D4RHX9_DREPO|nr:hypothetical protein DPMN_031323 [Dreissena polymorpha]
MTMYKKIFIFHLMMIVQRVAVSGQDCNKPADLYFVIDGSESVSDTDFKTTKNVLVEVLRSFNVSKDNVHVGANVFGRTVYDRIVLYGPSRSMYVLFETRLRSLSRTSQPGTATYLAIEEMRSDFRTYGRNVTKIAVVITDGKSADSTRTYEQARLAREAGVTMVAIGVGDVNEIFV